MAVKRVLDLDLDFFLQLGSRPRRNVERETINYLPWKERDVLVFLERNCGLSAHNRVPGQVFQYHHEVYNFCKKLRNEEPDLKFHIDHVDAHADLGFMDAKVIGLFTETIAVVDADWLTAQKEHQYGLDPGNYLLFFLFQGWLESLAYINHGHLLVGDINPALYFDEQKSRLAPYVCESLEQVNSKEGRMPLRVAQTVPFFLINYLSFSNCHTYDYVFLTISPDYTPPSAENLVPIFERYIEYVN